MAISFCSIWATVAPAHPQLPFADCLVHSTLCVSTIKTKQRRWNLNVGLNFV